MSDDPVVWIANHWAAGIELRENGLVLQTLAETGKWEKQQLEWAEEARMGILARSPRDVTHFDTLNYLPAIHLPAGHPWAQPLPAGMTRTSTGEGQPGNNPLAYHCRRLEVLQEIEHEWRERPPAPPSRLRGRPIGKAPFKKQTEKWEQEITAARRLSPDLSIRHVATAIAERTGRSLATIEREARYVRARRAGNKVPR